MTKRTEVQIPDDLRVYLAKDYVRHNFESGEPWSTTIARAILAERDRCANVALSVQDRSDDYNGAYDGVQDVIDGINNS